MRVRVHAVGRMRIDRGVHLVVVRVRVRAGDAGVVGDAGQARHGGHGRDLVQHGLPRRPEAVQGHL